MPIFDPTLVQYFIQIPHIIFFLPVISKMILMMMEAQWPIGYGVGLRIKRSSVRIRPVAAALSPWTRLLLPLSQGEAFTLASISYLAILVNYILAKKKKKKNDLQQEALKKEAFQSSRHCLPMHMSKSA